MARKKKSAPVHSGLGPSFLVRILPGKNHPRVFCSQGNGGFPALRLFRGAPNLGVLVTAWSMTSVYPVSTRSAEAVSVHPVARVGRTNSANCPPQAVGDALPCGNRSLHPSATLQSPRGLKCRPPLPVSWRPSVRFRRTGSDTTRSPRRGLRSHEHAHVAEATPAETGGGGASFVPDRDKSLWAPGPTHSQGAFSSEDGTESPSRLRSGGLSTTCSQVALRAQRPSVSRSSGEYPRPKPRVAVADTTRVGKNSEMVCNSGLRVFNNVDTVFIHNC